MATKTRTQLTEDRVERAKDEARALHPGDDITIEATFYGMELFVDVWKKGEPATIARYVDVVDDLEAELTRPDRNRSR